MKNNYKSNRSSGNRTFQNKTVLKRVTLVIGIFLSIISIQSYSQVGAALNFDGVDDRVDLGTTLGNFGTGNFTFETWFKSTATGDKTIISKRVACNVGNFWNLRLINGALYFEVYGATNVTTQSPLATYNDGNWHHVACVRNINVYSLYVDGVQVAQNNSGPGSASPYNFTNTASLLIGSGPCGSILGSLDETRIWNVARTTYEIQQSYTCEINGASTGLLVNMHYNQGIGGGTNTGLTTANDNSGNNNNGTLVGFALTGATSNWITPGAVTSGLTCSSIAPQNFQLNGNSGQDWAGGNCYTLTTNHTAEFGSMWYKQKVDLTQDFDMSANLNFGTSDSPGADGITFAFQNVCTSAGAAGGDIGIGGVNPSLVVEFDTYSNGAYGDPSYDHIAIQKNGDMNHTGANALVAPAQINAANVNVEDGADYLVHILWTHSNNTLQVFVNGNLRSTYTGDIVTLIFSGSPYVYWGFTAGTGGEFNKQKVCVTSLPTNIVSLASAATICNGSGYQANIPGYTTYSWSPSTGVSNTAIGNPILSPTSSTTYTLAVTDACSNVQTQTINIVVNPIPNVNASGATSVCAGSPTTISASGANAFVWSPAASLNNPNIANPVATPNITTTYTVTGTTNGCSSTATVTIDVNSVALTTASGAATICSGISTPLSASGAGTYSWSPASSLDNSSSANPVATPPSTTTYTVTGSAGGCSSSALVTVTVNQVPTLTLNSATVCIGQCATLTASPSIAGGSFVWSGSQTTQSIQSCPSNTTSYTVNYTRNNCSASATASVVANPVPSVAAGTATTICPGMNVVLSSISGADSYSWSPSTGLSANNIENPSAAPATTTNYTVTVGNSFGCTASAAVLITVNTITASAGSNVIITCGNNTTLNATGGNNYSWSPSTGLSNANIANPVASPQATTTYTVTANIGACSGTAAVTVSVLGYSAATSSNTTICAGSTTNLTATVTPSSGIYTNVHNGYTFNSQQGSYVNITNGTVIFNSSSPNMDDAVSGPITIPAFTFNNQTYTTIYVSTNGFITFGSAPTATNYTPLSSTETYAACIAPFGADIGPYSNFNSEIRYYNFGTDFAIQWKNYGRFGSSNTVDEEISFQLYLTPATNKVSVIYSSLLFTSSANYYPQVGLRGPNNTFATNLNNRAIPLQGGTWLNNTTAGTSNTSSCAINGFPNATNPGSGTAFVWTPSTFLSATYLWSPSTGLSNPAILNPVANPSTSTTYTLAVNYGTCTSSSLVNVTVDVCSGITEETKNTNVLIYPNPFSNSAIISIGLDIQLIKASIALYDLTGKKVSSFDNITTHSLEINRKDLQSGIYFYQFINNAKTISTGKIIIQ